MEVIATKEEIRIVDAHVHIWPENLIPKISVFLSEYYRQPWSEGGTYEHSVRSMERAGVYKSVVFSVATKAAQVENINDFLAGLPRGRIIPFGTLHPEYEDYKKEIKRIKELGLHGIKFHPDFQNMDIDDVRMMKIYEEVGSSLPMLIHLGDEKSDKSSPKRMARVLKEFPHIRVIGAHLGGYSRWDEAMEYLAGSDIMLETSSTIRFLGAERSAEMIKAHGADKVCFGTDYPMIQPEDELKNFMEMPLSREEQKKILGENILKYLNTD